MEEVSKETLSLRRARVRAVITGVAFFFPGFLFSLPVTCEWANHHYAGEAQAPLGAIGPSLIIGFVAAIWCTRHLLKKAHLEHDKRKSEASRNGQTL